MNRTVGLKRAVNGRKSRITVFEKLRKVTHCQLRTFYLHICLTHTFFAYVYLK